MLESDLPLVAMSVGLMVLTPLVVHGIPRGGQPGVLARLRGASLCWCAVTRPSVRL